MTGLTVAYIFFLSVPVLPATFDPVAAVVLPLMLPVTATKDLAQTSYFLATNRCSYQSVLL